MFLNNINVTVILPLFHENNFVADFKENIEHFNYFLRKQCFSLKKGEQTPTEVL